MSFFVVCFVVVTDIICGLFVVCKFGYSILRIIFGVGVGRGSFVNFGWIMKSKSYLVTSSNSPSEIDEMESLALV